MSSLWLHRTYYVFGFLLAVFVLTMIIIAEISIVLTYMWLCCEDYRWWWRSIFAGGSTALYLLVGRCTFRAAPWVPRASQHLTPRLLSNVEINM